MRCRLVYIYLHWNQIFVFLLGPFFLCVLDFLCDGIKLYVFKK